MTMYVFKSGKSRLLRISALAAVVLLGGCQRPTQLLPAAPIFEIKRVAGPGRDQSEPGSFATQADPAQFSGATTIYFESGVTDLSESARHILDIQAEWLDRHRDVKVLLQGHADEFGSREHQIALGARRAEAMKLYLAARGVAVNRMSVTSFGKQQPAAQGLSEADQKLNRRGETVLLGQSNTSQN